MERHPRLRSIQRPRLARSPLKRDRLVPEIPRHHHRVRRLLIIIKAVPPTPPRHAPRIIHPQPPSAHNHPLHALNPHLPAPPKPKPLPTIPPLINALRPPPPRPPPPPP